MTAEAAQKRSGGGFSRLVLWFVIFLLLATVWWLASERNQHHFRTVAENGNLVIERGRFFPTGTAPSDEKAYAPVPIPQGEKAPSEMEFEDQNALDRFLFDMLSHWAQVLAKKNDTHAASALVERAGILPGLTGGQVQQLAAMSADLSWDDAQQDLVSAEKLVEAARKKLAAVQSGKGSHALDATAQDQALQTVQRSLEAVAKPAK